jgi:hypothetical protein
VDGVEAAVAGHDDERADQRVTALGVPEARADRELVHGAVEVTEVGLIEDVAQLGLPHL